MELDVLLGGRRADEDPVLTLRRDPLAVVLVPVGPRLLCELDLDLLRLAGLQGDLPERLELLDRRRDPAAVGGSRDVHLRDLGAVELARVLDAEREGAVALGRDGADGQLRELECRVRETETEGESGSELGAVVVAVADVDALAVDNLARGLARDAERVERRVILKALAEAEREAAGRVDLAEENVGETVAELVATEKGLDEGRSLVDPREVDRSSGLVDDDRLRVGGEDRLDELVRGSRKLGLLAVKALGLPVRVRADDDDRDVALRGEIGSLLARVGLNDRREGTEAERGCEREWGSGDSVRVGVGVDDQPVLATGLELDLAPAFLGSEVKEQLAGLPLGLEVRDDSLTVDEDRAVTRRAETERPLAGDVRGESGSVLSAIGISAVNPERVDRSSGLERTRMRFSFSILPQGTPSIMKQRDDLVVSVCAAESFGAASFWNQLPSGLPLKISTLAPAPLPSGKERYWSARGT